MALNKTEANMECMESESGYASEAPVHGVSQNYPSLLVHVSVLLLDVLGSILHTLHVGRGRASEQNFTLCTDGLGLELTKMSLAGSYIQSGHIFED